MTTNPDTLCPCGNCIDQIPLTYIRCCKPFHSGVGVPATPEALMRSRYCAFVLKEYDYLIETHHPDYLDGLTAETLAQSSEPHWLSLDVLSTRSSAQAGEVCFQAWYREEMDIDAIHECSQFELIEGRWFYTQGVQKAAIFPKRNAPCVCNSGKKFKQCCMN
ncbi:YchJ family protein [uncultured Shewanella sp.]|uniref:YchJ family protein n=1 Tax=Shewanella atlantica TaxID=271099 RepID=UPI0026188398|nr:YchJ family protein [uncultured Shewanella sp.]